MDICHINCSRMCFTFAVLWYYHMVWHGMIPHDDFKGHMLPSMSAASYFLAKFQAVNSIGSNHGPTNQLSDFVAPQTSLLAQAGWCQNGSEASRCLRRQRPQESQESPTILEASHWCSAGGNRVTWAKCHCILAQSHRYFTDIAKWKCNPLPHLLHKFQWGQAACPKQKPLLFFHSILYTFHTLHFISTTFTWCPSPWIFFVSSREPFFNQKNSWGRPDHKNNHRGGPLALHPQRSHSLAKVAPVIESRKGRFVWHGCFWLFDGSGVSAIQGQDVPDLGPQGMKTRTWVSTGSYDNRRKDMYLQLPHQNPM